MTDSLSISANTVSPINRQLYYTTHALLLVVAGLGSQPVIADQQTQGFHITPQSLSSALNSYAEAANVQLSYQSAEAAGLSSPGVDGEYTPQQALQKLLKGTAITARQTENGTVTLERQAGLLKVVDNTQAAELSSEQTLPKVTVEANADNPYDDPTWATSPHNPDYNRPNAKTATKLDAPIMETPYSVSVVPQQLMADKQAIRLEDALNSVAGVQSSWINGGTSDVFMVRGFQNTNLYRDGFLMPDALSGGTGSLQMANLERVEVLKGPGSMLYGRNEPGGIINLVTKRPLATPYHAIQQQFGSYDLYRTTVDSTGAITADDQLLYRVNLAYENAGSFVDFKKTDDFFIAPSLTWNISDKTQANLDFQFTHYDNRTANGVPPIGNRPAPVPINRNVGDPLNNSDVADKYYVGADWSHAFNDNWKLTHRFGTQFYDQVTDFTFYFGKADENGNLKNIKGFFENSGNRGFNNGIVHQQNYYTTLNLTGKFNTAMLEHTALWGFDYLLIDFQSKSAPCCAAFPEDANFNVFNPNYQTSVNPLAHTYSSNPSFNQEWYGLYWQDQIKFPFNVYGNVGVRYDNATSTSTPPTGGEIAQSDDDHVSPRGGLLWRPIEWLSLYGNYSENFGVSNNIFSSPQQQNLPPQLANQWELGAKTNFFDGRLTASFAYFDLTKTNMPVAHPTIPNLQIPSGKRETRGYEFEVAGEILPGWRAAAAYTLLDYAQILVGYNGGVADDTGHRMYNTPRHYGSFWNTYEFQNAALSGLKIGGGIVAASQSQGTDGNTFQLPGYVTMNLMASYGMDVGKTKVSLQLNANNLLDKTYYSGTNTGSMIGVGSPRTFMGSVKVEF
jgi:iron complex outermembrane recepter protein